MSEEKPILGVENLYDYAKIVAATETPLDPILLHKSLKGLCDNLINYNYLMLLCRERNDYTVFNINNHSNIDSFVKDLKETLNNRGMVLCLDEQEDGSWEIWVRDYETLENFAYYLFNYSFGVIEV